MDNKELVILAGKCDDSGEVTPASIVTATGQMTPAQAVRTRENLGAAVAETVETVTGTTPTIEPQANTVYNCGELTSLTVSSFPASGWFEIDFDSGATPTVLTLPNDLDAKMPSGFTVEADTHYEINVKNGWPMVGSCPIPPAT